MSTFNCDLYSTVVTGCLAWNSSTFFLVFPFYTSLWYFLISQKYFSWLLIWSGNQFQYKRCNNIVLICKTKILCVAVPLFAENAFTCFYMYFLNVFPVGSPLHLDSLIDECMLTWTPDPRLLCLRVNALSNITTLNRNNVSIEKHDFTVKN